MDKCVWVLAGSGGGDKRQLRDLVLADLPATALKLLGSVSGITATFQDTSAYSGAAVMVDRVECQVDMVLEVAADLSFVPLDDFNKYPRTIASSVQGWRVRPTLIYDSTQRRSVGAPSAYPNVLVFVERLDGTTPEHFSRNWYIHAGHLDGLEAESEQSLMARRTAESEVPDWLYRQNRVIEAITPTEWVIHGYTQLQIGGFVPPVGAEGYPQVRGEDPFDQWPPRILQGYEYRL